MVLYALLPDRSYETGHYVIDDPNKPAHKEIIYSTRVLILKELPDGFYIYRYSTSRTFPGDTWHKSLEEAFYQAKEEYGIDRNAWKEVPKEVKDPVEYAMDLLNRG